MGTPPLTPSPPPPPLNMLYVCTYLFTFAPPLDSVVSQVTMSKDLHSTLATLARTKSMGFDEDAAGDTSVKRTSSGRRPSMYSEDHNDSVLRTVEIIRPDEAHAAAVAEEMRNDADGHSYTKVQVRSNIQQQRQTRFCVTRTNWCLHDDVLSLSVESLRRPPPLAHTHHPSCILFFHRSPLTPPPPSPRHLSFSLSVTTAERRSGTTLKPARCKNSMICMICCRKSSCKESQDSETRKVHPYFNKFVLVWLHQDIPLSLNSYISTYTYAFNFQWKMCSFYCWCFSPCDWAVLVLQTGFASGRIPGAGCVRARDTIFVGPTE